MKPLNLVVASDAIAEPLTGIGRYSYELVRGLQAHPEIGSLRYFSMGRWVIDPVARLDAKSRLEGSALGRGRTPWTLRSVAAANPVAVKAYECFSPALYRWRLRYQKDAIFHAPNYFVPKFPGRTVSTVHDLSHLRYPHFHPEARVRFMRKALVKSLQMTDHVITVSESTRRELIDLFDWPEDKVTAIALGTGAVFAPREPAALHETLKYYGLHPGRYSLFVGTIEARKNVDRLIDAYAALPQDIRQEWPLVIAGSHGWQSARTHERMQTEQEAGWLRYLNFVPDQDLPLLYAGARLFVYPSIYEGFGLPVAEAMASGVPVITSNVSSMPEVAGGAAHLVDPLDTDELHHALRTCLQDESWRRRAIVAGLTRAKDFSWQTCVDQTVAVYRKVRRDTEKADIQRSSLR